MVFRILTLKGLYKLTLTTFHLNTPLEVCYADDAVPEVEDGPVNDDPWVSILTSFVQDPALSESFPPTYHKQCP